MKKATLTLMLISLSLIFSATAAKAVPINGGFETGDLSGWAVVGNPTAASVVTEFHTFNVNTPVTMLATEGKYFALIEAGQNVTTLVSSPFFISMGETLSFDWFFKAGDYLPFNDFASFALEVLIGGVPVWSNVLSQVATVGDFGLTGWHAESFLAPLAGDMALKFFSVNVGDEVLSSFLGVDNVHISNGITNNVPEPGTLLLVMLGAFGLFFVAKNNPLRPRTALA